MKYRSRNRKELHVEPQRQEHKKTKIDNFQTKYNSSLSFGHLMLNNTLLVWKAFCV